MQFSNFSFPLFYIKKIPCTLMRTIQPLPLTGLIRLVLQCLYINNTYCSTFRFTVIYFSKEKMRRGVRRGCVRLRGAVVGIDDEDDSTFTITVDNKTFHFQVNQLSKTYNWYICRMIKLLIKQVACRMIGRKMLYIRQDGLFLYIKINKLPVVHRTQAFNH